MDEDKLLRIVAVLSVVLGTLHMADDVLHFQPGLAPGHWQATGGATSLVVIPIFVVFLYGATVLAGRRSGYVIVLVGSLLSATMCVVHLINARFQGGEIAKASSTFFFVWGLFAIGVTGAFGAVLAARGLWRSRAAATSPSRS